MNRFEMLRAMFACGAVVASCATRHEDERVLPPKAEASFQAVIRDANEGAKLGKSVSVTRVRIDAERATVSLHRDEPEANAQVVLTHRESGRGGRPQWFTLRVEPDPPPEALAPAVHALGTLLDTHFPNDPWAVASTLPRPEPKARDATESVTLPVARWDGHGVDSFRTRSRFRVLGGAGIVALLSLSLLVWLWVDKLEE